MINIHIKKLTQNATIPTRGTIDSAGLDLRSAINLTIKPSDKALIPTDIAISIPKTYYGRIAPRSSMAWKKHSDIGAGVIDSDYRGNVSVVIFNLSTTNSIEINIGDRIAQLIIEKYYPCNLINVKEDILDNTERNTGGFGYTGE
tara:strand:+ start:375 stop:809 length:435 start_codon:yes stop_codon:yes gene_type:complete